MGPAVDSEHRGSFSTGLQALLVAGCVCAVVATVLAVFVSQVVWLRLAVLLGVWAALFAALALARSRRDVRAAQRQTDESRLTHQLELQRELTARLEYQTSMAADARAVADRQHREDLAGLREQVDRLNSMLSTLLDGDLLVEKLTLSAESTRIRPIGRSDRSPSDRSSGGTPALAPASGAGGEEPAEPADGIVESSPDGLPVGAADPTEAAPDRAPRSAHSSGVSVADLLASLGGTRTGARRRRRLAE